MTSAVRPIFNKSFAKKRDWWVHARDPHKMPNSSENADVGAFKHSLRSRCLCGTNVRFWKKTQNNMHLASRFHQNMIFKTPRNHVLEPCLQLAFYENASFNLITKKQHKCFRGINTLNTLKYLLNNKFINP